MSSNAAKLADCVETLKYFVEDRNRLADLSEDERRELLEAAGRLAVASPEDRKRLRRTMRKKDKKTRREHDRVILDSTGMREAQSRPVYVPPPKLFLPEAEGPSLLGEPVGGEAARPSAAPPLLRAKKCYVCKVEFREVHFFYDQMCAACADFNYAKRHQTADLKGRVVLITGSRVKIGYQAALMLLRAGARVIVTTRFPSDAAVRYASEPDFASFAERLAIYGLDLRHTPSVEYFANYLCEHESRLDFILHNACQTVRRPPGYYGHLMAGERDVTRVLPAESAGLLAAHQSLLAERGEAHRKAGAHLPGFVQSAELSQLPLTQEDHLLTGQVEVFPEGRLDQDLQQVDLRAKNSWRLTLAEVPTVELLEVQLVNAIAPFVLSARLKPLMTRVPSKDKHIVNVSAMEGQFYRGHKTDKHPHTNMAKAALNMLTRTSAMDYIQDGIHMNSVDTGWITDEDPAHITERKADEHGFRPPLDIVDGAARICDPIFAGLNSGDHKWGGFFKDYKPVPW